MPLRVGCKPNLFQEPRDVTAHEPLHFLSALGKLPSL